MLRLEPDSRLKPSRLETIRLWREDGRKLEDEMEAFDTAEDRAFRNEVRAFFDENLSDEIRRAMLTGLPAGREISDRWHKILLAKGWAAPNWPKEHGGTGW